MKRQRIIYKLINMKKETKSKEKLICGKTEKEIRKAFFKNKIGELIADIQAEKNVAKKDVQELNEYLLRLKDNNDTLVDEAVKLFGGKIVGVETENKPPTVAELKAGVSDQEWREKADIAIEYVSKTMTSIRRMVATKKNIRQDFWLDTATVILSYEELIDKDRVFKDQIYRAKMTEIIDEFQISRKEAEERARITKEYSDYKNAILLRDRIDEFINLAKKQG